MVPNNDDDFDTTADQFFAAVSPAPAAYGLTQADVDALKVARASWKVSLPAHKKAHADAITATIKKDSDRTSYDALVRGGMKKVKATHGITPELLAAAAITPSSAGSSSGEITSRPLGRVDLKPNSTVVVHFVDELTPTRTAKPANAHGCEVWSFVGAAPPASPSGYAFVALDTRTPYTDAHPATDAGKNVYYLLRWQNFKGDPGPWSDVITAKIPG
jgi:hypothetical protein